MARIELSEIPDGLSPEEREMVRMARIAAIVNDKDGYKRNPDEQDHPFANYVICQQEVSYGDGTISRCGAVFSTRESAHEHAAAHMQTRMSLGYNRALDKSDKPI